MTNCAQEALMRHTLLGLCLFTLPLAAIPSSAQTTYSAPDKSLTFDLPATGWQVTWDGRKARLTAKDGSRYVLSCDTIPAKPTGEPANSPALRQAAEELVKPLLSTYDYAGVRPIKVAGGSGAIFRFRGKGTKSDSDLAEVWIGFSGPRSAVLMQETAPLPDHFYGLSTLFSSLSFGGVTAPGDKSAENVTRRPKSGSQQPSTRVPTNGVSPAREKERYEGHLMSGDVSFTLRLIHGGKAHAEWMRSPGRSARYEGDYEGDSGNYTVDLKRVDETGSTAPSALALTLTSLGGMVKATYVAGAGSPQRAVSELKLTSVDAPNIRLRGSKPTAKRNASAGNTSSMIRNTVRRDTSMRRNAARIIRRSAGRRRR
jgi:hypothetical protein